MTAAADFKTACRDVAVTDEAAVDPLIRNLGNEFMMMIICMLHVPPLLQTPNREMIWVLGVWILILVFGF